jgi:hypothetical protein
MPYVITHHPVRWSFVPANVETLRLLGEKYDIGTIVVPFDHSTVKLRRADVMAVGFEPHGKYRIDGTLFSVFKRPAPQR